MEHEPALIFDGDCSFCRVWIKRWEERTGNQVTYIPFQQAGILEKYRISKSDAQNAIQLISPSGERFQGAKAVFVALSQAPELRFLKNLADTSFTRWIAEPVYRFVARHRKLAGWLNWMFFGSTTLPPRRRLTRALYFRGLGFTYFAAFRSLEKQVLGLYGSRGILPVQDYLSHLRSIPSFGRRKYAFVPTLFWWNTSDRFLLLICQIAEACSVALILGIAPRLMSLFLWVFYLSFVSVGQEFLSYQWDALLLEAGVNSILAAPPGMRSKLNQGEDPPWLIQHLFRLLFFRLYFESGLCKLQSQDPTWRGCTACVYHYETQPLPTPLGWYFHHLPQKFQRLSTRIAIGTELIVSGLIYFPRKIRRIAFAFLVSLQGIIAATGNYGFFNLLTSILALWSADDAMLLQLLPKTSYLFTSQALQQGRLASLRRQLITSILSVPFLVLSVFELAGRIKKTKPLLEKLEANESVRKWKLYETIFHLCSSYGLFAVMTTSRPEIVIEGSNDGIEWKEYEFYYKPGNPKTSPRYVAPHQPRLDWQMWFAAMQPPPHWFLNLMMRLLQGSPEVIKLLKDNPFPAHPPRLIRAAYYKYQIASFEEYRNQRLWWQRERLGLYFPPCQVTDQEEAA